MREKVQKHPWIFLHFQFFVVSLHQFKWQRIWQQKDTHWESRRFLR